MRKWLVLLAIAGFLLTTSGCGTAPDEEMLIKDENINPTIESTEETVPELDSTEYWEIVQDEIVSMLKKHNLYVSATTHGYPCKQFHVEPGIVTNDGKAVASGLPQG